MKRTGIGALLALLAVIAGVYLQQGSSARTLPLPPASAPAPEARSADGDAAPQNTPQRRSDTQLTVFGVVTRILADDRDGSRHQRFIIQVEADETLLVAHNIDLAPRLDGLSVGERVTVSGEYEWNPWGGTVHWTHHDPQGRHVPGYIEWRGRRYQ